MDGIINLLKPAGMTSNDCILNLRRIIGEKKIGHTGTLDPNACGVLPMVVGKAARFGEYMDEATKTYRCGMILGYVSDSQDMWGSVEEFDKSRFNPEKGWDISEEEIEQGLNSFLGEIIQVPSAFSAIRINGRHAYELAREGKQVEMQGRRVFIHSIELKSYDALKGTVSFEVCCSKGTYVRSICHDLGIKLGCGAVMDFLVRTSAAGLDIQESISLEELKALMQTNPEDRSWLLPLEKAVESLPKIEISGERFRRLFSNGVPYHINNHQIQYKEDPQQVYGVYSDGTFLGTAVILSDHEGPYLKGAKIYKAE